MVSRYLLNFDTTNLPQKFTEYLVIGTGIAGLYTALKASRFCDVTVLTKKKLEDSNTEYAQGGIAAAIDEKDSPLFHYEDTIKAGAGLCDNKAVDILVNEGPDRVKELMDIGTHFDKIGDVLALTREGAHSHRRVLHAKGDATGEEIRRALAKQIKEEAKVKVLENSFVVDILTRNGECHGALVIDDEGEKSIYWSKAVIIATGGIGQVYNNTTNPDVATGDGIAMAYRAGAELMDMEFVQFHPTALSIPGIPPFLISEAVRGEGALLRNSYGQRFMPDYHPQAELAPRDIVSRAIVSEMQKTEDSKVFLDLSPLGEGKVRTRFPNITRTCIHYGVDIDSNMIPVAPAAHYMMGGVKTNYWGETIIKGLYACGEASCLAVHGANRLASNSLLDGLVFGERIVEASKEYVSKRDFEKLPHIIGKVQEEESSDGFAERTRQRLQNLMWEKVGIIREEEELKEAQREIKELLSGALLTIKDIKTLELVNMLIVSELITKAALLRLESRGGHFRRDYPETNDQQWNKHIILSK